MADGVNAGPADPHQATNRILACPRPRAKSGLHHGKSCPFEGILIVGRRGPHGRPPAVEALLKWTETTFGTVLSFGLAWLCFSIFFCLLIGGIATRLKRSARRRAKEAQETSSAN